MTSSPALGDRLAELACTAVTPIGEQMRMQFEKLGAHQIVAAGECPEPSRTV